MIPSFLTILPNKLLKNRFLQHLVFWISYLVIYTYNFGKPGAYSHELLITLLFIPCHLLFTYTQLYWAVPKFLLKGRIIMYIIVTIIITRACIALMWIIDVKLIFPINGVFPELKIGWDLLWKISPAIFKSIFSLYMIGGIAVAIKLVKQWYQMKNTQQQLEKEKLHSELQLLKAQVHPHFLFNTLNNLYSHTLEGSRRAPEIVLKLSNLLRYMLYECNADEVLLEKEIEVMKDYIELEQLRYDDRLEVSVNITGETKNRMIAPLLLLPFLENSFKHGTSEQIDQCWITMDLYIEGSQLKCKLINSKSASEKSGDYIGGIGLQNVQKRLELIYKDQFNLKMIAEEEVFIVSLTVELHDDKVFTDKNLLLSSSAGSIIKNHEATMSFGG